MPFVNSELVCCYCRSATERQPLNELQRQWEKEDKEFKQFSCALKLSIAFAANVGGIGSLIGCGPNIVLKGQVDE